MRVLIPLACLLCTGCPSGTDDTDSATPWVTDTNTETQGTGGSGTTTSGSGGSGSGGSGVGQTVVSHLGDATVDPDLGTWQGTEAVRFLTVSAGDLVCQWTWDVNEAPVSTTTGTPAPGEHSSTDLPCTDADGNSCTFSFDVNLSGGAQTQGNCASFNLPAEGGVFHYGYLDDYLDGGVSYGSMFVYYLAPVSTSGDPVWFPVERYGVGAHSWDSKTGALTYEIPHTLLGPITP